MTMNTCLIWTLKLFEIKSAWIRLATHLEANFFRRSSLGAVARARGRTLFSILSDSSYHGGKVYSTCVTAGDCVSSRGHYCRFVYAGVAIHNIELRAGERSQKTSSSHYPVPRNHGFHVQRQVLRLCTIPSLCVRDVLNCLTTGSEIQNRHWPCLIQAAWGHFFAICSISWYVTAIYFSFCRGLACYAPPCL